VPNFGASNFIKQKLLDWKAQIDLNTMIGGEFHNQLSPVDRSATKEIQN
jgi:hypothetical protein